MKITRISKLTDIERTLEIDISDDQLNRWDAGEFIQDVAPELSRSDREFIMTGITQEEWDAAYGDEDEDDDF